MSSEFGNSIQVKAAHTIFLNAVEEGGRVCRSQVTQNCDASSPPGRFALLPLKHKMRLMQPQLAVFTGLYFIIARENSRST